METVVRAVPGHALEDVLATVRLERELTRINARVAELRREQERARIAEALGAGEWVRFGVAS